MPETSLVGALSFVATIVWEIVKILFGTVWEVIYDIPPSTYMIALSVIGLCVAGKSVEDVWEKSSTKARLERDLEEAFLNTLEIQTVKDRTSCRVCGEAFGEIPLVACRLCGTIHHEDCWDYAGQCSIYGCGATRSMKEV